MDSTELPSSSTRVFDGSEEPAGTHGKFDQSTGRGAFRRWLDQLLALEVDWIMRRHFRQRKFIAV